MPRIKLFNNFIICDYYDIIVDHVRIILKCHLVQFLIVKRLRLSYKQYNILQNIYIIFNIVYIHY